MEGVSSGIKYLLGGLLFGASRVITKPISETREVTSLPLGIGKGIGVAATAAAISVDQVCRGIYNTKETLVNSQKAYMIWDSEKRKWVLDLYFFPELRDELTRYKQHEKAEVVNYHGGSGFT